MRKPPLLLLLLLLQIVKSPPPAGEAEVQAQLMLLRMQANKLKQYPSLDSKQRERDAAQNKVGRPRPTQRSRCCVC